MFKSYNIHFIYVQYVGWTPPPILLAGSAHDEYVSNVLTLLYYDRPSYLFVANNL